MTPGTTPDDTDATLVGPGPRAAGYPFLSPPERGDEIGRLGPYRVLAELGRGGMGVVFRAEETVLKRQVALKVMLSAAADAQADARFRREAEAQAAVEHDHIIPIYRVDKANGVPFLAMPLLKGQTLAAALRLNPRPPLAEVARIGAEMAEGLSAAHAAGLVHRDIKPANIWLEGNKRRVKILDFGLARVATGVPEAQAVSKPMPALPPTLTDATGPYRPVAVGDTQLTQAGAAVGTPAYMSPEQARGLPTDSRTDLFSLGVVLYEMATGERPFAGTTTLEVMAAVMADPHTPARDVNPAVPAALSDLIDRLLAKDPDARPPAAAAVAADLAAVGRGLAVLPVVVAPVGDLGAPNPWFEFDSTQTDAAAVAPPRPGAAASPRWLWPAVGLACAAAVGAAVWASVGASGSKPPPTPEAAEAPKPPAPRPKGPAGTSMSVAATLASTNWTWTEPENLGPAVNGVADDVDPALSGDGLRLVFASARDGALKLYEARRATTAEPFADVRRLDALCPGPQAACQPFLSLDGKSIVYVIDTRPGGQGRLDIWESRRADRDAPWDPPKNLGPTVNDPWDDSWPAVSPDGLTLYNSKWSTWTPVGKNFELRIQRRATPAEPWGRDEWFGPHVNSLDAEIAPRPLADGSGVLFTRLLVSGKADWLIAVPKAGGWDVDPVRLDHRDHNPTLTADGRTAVFQSDRPGGRGRIDLWQMRLVPKK
jgi:serine/threonine protein kinase